MKKFLMYRSGFSLIELLVIIVIIGILSVIGFFAFEKFVANSKSKTAKQYHTEICNLIKSKAIQCKLTKGKINFTDDEGRNWSLNCPVSSSSTARDYFYREVSSIFKNPFESNRRGVVASPNIKKDKLLDSRYWGLVSLVPSGNNIIVYTNIGRIDGNKSQGDIKECVAKVVF